MAKVKVQMPDDLMKRIGKLETKTDEICGGIISQEYR